MILLYGGNMKRLIITTIAIILLLSIVGRSNTGVKGVNSKIVEVAYKNEELEDKLDGIIARCEELDTENKRLRETTKHSENNLRNLEKDLAKGEEEIKRLKEKIIELKDNKIAQAQQSVISKDEYNRLLETRFAAYSRLIFEYPEKDYEILTDYYIKNDWYMINQESFELRLKGYENAQSVAFFLQKIESEINPTLLYKDDTQEDGWTYINDKVDSVIEENTKSYIPRYVIYTEVTFDNGREVRTSLLPIYNPAD